MKPHSTARTTGLFLSYDLPLEETGTPLPGTTVVQEEGLQLLRVYLAGLR